MIDLATRIQSFDEVAAEKITYVKGYTLDIINEINVLRTNPSEYIKKLEHLYSAFIDDTNVFRLDDGTRVNTKEGRKAVTEAITVLRGLSPLSAMEPSAFLESAAYDHAKDLGDNGIRGHEGSDGSSVADRIERYCAWRGIIGENIDYGNNNANDIVLSLLVDDGVSDRGHRENLLNPNYRFVGAAIGPYPEYVHHCLCVLDFSQNVIPLSAILSKDMKITLKSLKDLELEDVNKLISTVPYVGNMYDEFREHLLAKDEIYVEFSAVKKNIKMSFIHDKMTRVSSYNWA